MVLTNATGFLFLYIYCMKYLLIFALLIFLVGCRSIPNADLIIENAVFWTADTSLMRVEGIAIEDGFIRQVGSKKEIDPLKSPETRVIDAKGHFVMPGLIEGHGHFSGLGYSLIDLNFLHAKSWEEIVNQVATAAKKSKPGEWIIGRGWHQEKWDSIPEKNIHNYPFHQSLSHLTPNNPVMLIHASGHALFANQKAMEEASISRDTESPAGGEIVKDIQGDPIGIFEERAMLLIREVYQHYKNNLNQHTVDSIWLSAINKAQKSCLENGITSFQDAGSTFSELTKYENLAMNNQLNVRLWVMARESKDSLVTKLTPYKKIGVGNHFYTCNAIKSEVDGALGAFGAWLLAPYNDKPGFSGQNTTDIYDVKAIADLAVQLDMQFCVHAIGDRANRVVLDIYEGMMELHPEKQDWRWRIEHAQHLDTADIPRFAKNKIIASMQGIHCTSDAPFVVKRLGVNRAKKGAYAWRSLLDKGVIIANGTDTPVEDLNPFKNIYASVTRTNRDANLTFFPEQKMTREEALISYTLGNAFAAKEDHLKGSLRPGKLADIIIIDKNLLTCPEDEILSAKVLYTIVGGEIKYKAPNN